MQDLQPWKTLSSRELLSLPPWIRVSADRVQLPDGRIVDNFYQVEMPEYTVIFAQTTDGLVVTERHYKHGVGRIILALPAGYLEPGEDPVVDPGTDPVVDPGTDPGTDPVVDPGTDPATDPGIDTGGCTYPSGPYAYTRIGDVVGPASWATAIQASGETFPSPTARFEDFHCDPGVDSIIIFLATQS